MLDLEKKSYYKLKENDIESSSTYFSNLLIDGEDILLPLTSKNDKVIFTSHRIIIATPLGLTGTKIDFTSIPYNKIVAYSIETKGDFMDKDVKLDLVINTLGKINFEFVTENDIRKICKILSESILN